MRNYCTIYFIVIFAELLAAETLSVPDGFPTIQQAIDAATDGDTVLVHPGIYLENLEIDDKSVVLASLFILTKNKADIVNTVIDGDGGDYVLRIRRSDKEPMSIIGLTIRNGDDGIMPNAKFNITNCRVEKCVDGIDYESGSGGICRANTFVNNDDDGIDLDGDVEILIENNHIINNDDDGIEIRLHDYTGVQLKYDIRNNVISGNDEDGIQIIDYPGFSDRILSISNNLIINNAMAGIGLMGDGRTKENYEGAPIEEPIYIINNTFSGNEYGLTGGANLVAKNNIIINCAQTAFKNVSNQSLVSYSCLWNNGSDFENSNTDEQTNKVSDPSFADNVDYFLAGNSKCIDAGDPQETFNDPADDNDSGSAQWPASGTVRNDMGAYGGPFAADWNLSLITKIVDKRSASVQAAHFQLNQNYPNPFNPKTMINYQLPIISDVNLSIYNLPGQKVATLVNKKQAAGSYSVEWDASGFASGIYIYTLETSSGFTQNRKLLLLK